MDIDASNARVISGEGTTLPLDASIDTLVKFAAAESISEDALNFLANHERDEVRCALSNRSDLPEKIVWLLASDAAPRVRYKLAGNKSLSEFALEALAEDEHQSVAERAFRTLSAVRNTNKGGLELGKVLQWFLAPELKKAG